MDRDRDKMAERILHLTLEILFRLTGEDYTVVKKTSSECCQDPVSEGWGRPLSPITGPPPHPLIHEDINDQKILELTYKMIELLTGEVPIRCQDVTIYFSMEEWQYLEGHKDLYKDVMMEVPQPLTSKVLSSERTTPESLPQDCNQGNPNVAQDHQDKDLTHINTTETYVRENERCTEAIPTDNCKDDCTRISGKQPIFSHVEAGDHSVTPDTYEKCANIQDIVPAIHSKDLSCDLFQQVLSIELFPTVKNNKNNRRVMKHKISYIRKKSISCLECGKCCSRQADLVKHQRIHTGEKPFLCTECGKCFADKSNLTKHQIIHTRENLSCPECGKCYSHKYHLARHKKIHTGDKPFSCSECGKCFYEKTNLVAHQRIHTGENAFSCLVCGKYFPNKSNLVIHHRSHTGEKPYSCSECGKCFISKSNLVKHQRIHTGEKPFSCSECGKYFTSKTSLFRHQRAHTGEKSFSCSECGKCFKKKSFFVAHQKIHIGE
ncbi:uncharacterized protein ACNLHF_021756 [Anomaloglossus baeobatrachus]